MSRELKFRVWDKVDKKFMAFMDADIVSGQIYSPHPIEEFIIQQFIGLLDKNGKEIYEGDIVNYKEYNEIDNFAIDVNLVCIYSPYNAWFSFVVDVENEHDEGYYWMEIKDKCEVVGNIFEKL